MAIDFSFPAWLRDQHSFADSLAKGAQVGAIIANNRYRNQALAAQVHQNELDNMYREKDLEFRSESHRIALQSQLQLKEGMVELGKTLSGIASTGGWTNPESEAKFWETVARYPSVTQSPNFDNIVGTFDRAKHAQLQRDLAAQRAADGFAPGALEKDMTYYQEVLKQGDPEIIGLTRSILQSKAQKSGFSVEFNPDGTVNRIAQGPVAAGAVPTTGFKGKLQEQLHGTAGTLELLATMQQNMGSSDFGLPGIARDLKVRLGPLFGMDVSDEDLSVRKTIPLLRAALQKELKSDSNITEAERKDIAKALPSESWLESKESAQQSLNVLIPWLKNRVVRNAEALSIPVPRSAMTADQVRAAYESGEMTLDEARDTIKRFGIQIPRLPQDEGPAPMIENAR